jgi:hypothetical protein
MARSLDTFGVRCSVLITLSSVKVQPFKRVAYDIVLGAALKYAHLLLRVKVEGIVVSHRLAFGLKVYFASCHSSIVLRIT